MHYHSRQMLNLWYRQLLRKKAFIKENSIVYLTRCSLKNCLPRTLQTHFFEKKPLPLSSCEHFLNSTVPSFYKLSFYLLLKKQRFDSKKKQKNPKARRTL